MGCGLALFLGGAGYALLSESNGFDLVALFGDDNMRLGGMVRGALRFVVAGDSGTFQSGIRFVGHYLWVLPFIHLPFGIL